MEFPIRQNQVPKPKEKSDDCEIDIRKTKSGKKIKFSGKCSPAQINVLAQENNIDLDND